jgi:hypothetical protein
MKKILLIATVYRVGERIYSTLPELSKEFSVDVLKTAQMGNKIKWYGDNDLRLIFDNKYKNYIQNLYYKPPDLNKYDLILMDDDRPRHGNKEIYDKVNVPVIGQHHGNIKFRSDVAKHTSWDYISVFGQKEKDIYIKNKGSQFGKKILLGGIPSNDLLNEYERTDKHILVIVNFLGNRGAPFKKFDKDTFTKMGLVELQKKFNKKVIIKIKSREAFANPHLDFEYLDKILPGNLDYEVLMDVEDDNKLICDSFFVISAPSTLAFKSIQKGIPTVLLEGYGFTASFYDYNGLIKLNTQKLFDELQRQFDVGRDDKFINYTIEGGLKFNSSEKYINNVRRLLS